MQINRSILTFRIGDFVVGRDSTMLVQDRFLAEGVPFLALIDEDGVQYCVPDSMLNGTTGDSSKYEMPMIVSAVDCNGVVHDCPEVCHISAEMISDYILGYSQPPNWFAGDVKQLKAGDYIKVGKRLDDTDVYLPAVRVWYKDAEEQFYGTPGLEIVEDVIVEWTHPNIAESLTLFSADTMNKFTLNQKLESIILPAFSKVTYGGIYLQYTYNCNIITMQLSGENAASYGWSTLVKAAVLLDSAKLLSEYTSDKDAFEYLLNFNNMLIFYNL